MAERCLELMVARVTSRTAFGKLLAQQGSILQDIALSRTEIEQSRLLTLKAAHMCVPGIHAFRISVCTFALTRAWRLGWTPWATRQPGTTLR